MPLYVDEEPRLYEPRFRILSTADLRAAPPMDWRVGEVGAGIVPSYGLSAIYGLPGSGKSFLACDLACTIARTDRQGLWLGNAVTHCPVLYVVAEGRVGFRKRVTTWMDAHGLIDGDLAIGFVEAPVNLYRDASDVSYLLRAIDEIPAFRVDPPRVVMFDTLAHCMVGGDDNSARDIAQVVEHAGALRDRLDANVGMVMHARKDGDAERGSVALRGAVDTLMQVRDDEESRVLSCEKQKDDEAFVEQRFWLQPHRDSCVVSMAEPARSSRYLSANQRKALDALTRFEVHGATSTEWLQATGIPQRTFYNVRKTLLDRRYVQESERGKFFLQMAGRSALNASTYS